MMSVTHRGITDEYRKNVEAKLGDAAQKYIEMLIDLSKMAFSCTPDTLEKTYNEMTAFVVEIKNYVEQFGFIFTSTIIMNEKKRWILRIGLFDLASGQMVQ